MPHVVVWMYPGRTEETKRNLTEAVVRAVCETCGVGPETVSVAVEEVPKERWMEEVYGPRIAGKADRLTKRPGYGPLAEGR